MLRDEAFLIEAEDIKRHLLACACEVVYGLQEDLVAVLKRADVVNGGLYRSGSKIRYAAYECVTAGAVCQVVLDVAFRQKGSCLLGVAGCEGVNENQCFFDLILAIEINCRLYFSPRYMQLH